MGAPSEYDFQNLGVHLHDPFPHVFFSSKKEKGGRGDGEIDISKDNYSPPSDSCPKEKKRKALGIYPSI